MGGPALAAGMPAVPLAGDAARFDVGISSLIAVGPAFRWVAAEPRLADSPRHGDALAVGGFLEYAVDAFRFGGSVTEGAGIARAELTAGYVDGATSVSVRLGSEWGDGAAIRFSPNPARFGLSDAAAAPNDLDVGFTVRHDITPSLYVSGTAAATAPAERPEAERPGLLFGASIGLKF